MAGFTGSGPAATMSEGAQHPRHGRTLRPPRPDTQQTQGAASPSRPFCQYPLFRSWGNFAPIRFLLRSEMGTSSMRGSLGRPRRFAIGASLVALSGAPLACSSARPQANPTSPAGSQANARALHADIAYLASDRLEGRGTGTPGNDSAAAYIARRFNVLGLTALAPDFEQEFVAHPLAAHNAAPRSLRTQNVVALLPGRDPVLRAQYVVVGAHFDHLGRSTEGALDPDRKNAVRRGADDNASGTAAVLELARLFAAAPARRSLVFIA